MKKSKTIVNNCISDIINNNKFKRIFVYGAENLELEKLIYNLTSSPITGGDVDCKRKPRDSHVVPERLTFEQEALLSKRVAGIARRVI